MGGAILDHARVLEGAGAQSSAKILPKALEEMQLVSLPQPPHRQNPQLEPAPPLNDARREPRPKPFKKLYQHRQDSSNGQRN